MRYDILDMAAVRVQHSLVLLRLLWREDAPRIDLSRQVGLSRSAISSIVQELMEVGLVSEGERRVSERVGRRATMLSLHSRAAHLLAVDLGASHLKVALLDLRCTVLAQRECPHDVRQGPQATYPLIRRLAEEVLQASGVPEQGVAALGVGVPGPVDFRSGQVIRPPNMPGWDGEHVGAELGRLFDCPVLVDNDANLGALAEWKFGAHAGTPDLIYIKAATGIGSGVLLGGRLHRGVSGGAGEIGHISINEQGPLGRSGNPGSLESYAAAGVVLAKMRSRVGSHPGSCLTETSDMADLTRLSRQDPLARELWGEVGRHLGVAITTGLNLFNPSVVVIGGQMAAAGEPLITAVRQVVQERAMLVNRDAVKITQSSLGPSVGILGAAVMALETLLSPDGLPRLREVSRRQRAAGSGSRAPPAARPLSTIHSALSSPLLEEPL
ncbi:ROK family transcriptional regulator [Deinococcus sonorensis]|uniref:ROK family transcriptional regulator n=2 Tax=Deinococcus sonorensis TaxID=309891 RepID=A0AAU7UAS2_9DEIO